MYISFVIAIDRQTGKAETLALVATVTHDQAPVAEVREIWREFNAASGKGAELRAKYSHATCWLLNASQGTRSFRDRDAVEEKAKREQRADEERQRKAAVKAAVEAAKAALAEATAAARALGVKTDSGSNPKIKALQAERDKLQAELDELRTKPSSEKEGDDETRPPSEEGGGDDKQPPPPPVADGVADAKPSPPPDA